MALSDVEISRITGIPCITLAKWKKKMITEKICMIY